MKRHHQPVAVFRPLLPRLVLALVAGTLALSFLAPVASATPSDAPTADLPDTDGGEMQTQIVGGGDVTRYGHDFMVALVRRSDLTDQYCGGSLITPYHVVTAAHCVDSTPEQFELTVRAGVTDLADVNEGERIDPSSYTLHPDWSQKNGDPDIAIIRLSRASTYQPIRIGAPGLHQDHLSDPPESQRRVIALGWGLTDGDGGDTYWLKGLSMKLYSDQYMTSTTPFQAFKTAHHIGAGAHELPNRGGVSNGDSGGPLFMHGRNWPERTVHGDYDGPILVGVANFVMGPPYNRDKFPSVWAAVDEGNLLGWVASKVRGLSCGASKEWRFATGIGPVCATVRRVS